MLGPLSPISGGLWSPVTGGTTGFSGRDVIWADLRFPSGANDGSDANPYSTANTGFGALPNGGTLLFVGGDASGEPGINIGARSHTVRGLGGQSANGGLAPVLPTLTYAITTGTQRLAYHHVSVAITHSGTAAGLTQFFFEYCPSVMLTAGGDTSPVYWVGDANCSFSGSGGAGTFVGGTIGGYTANGSGTIGASGCNITGALTSSTTITLVGACTFGPSVSVTAPSIQLDPASYKNAVAAGVTFSSPPNVMLVFGTPVDIGTANSAGSSQAVAHADHIHNLPFSAVNATLATANAPINVNGQRITGAGTPTGPTDLVTKAYADAGAVGLKVKTPAVAVATANQATLSGTAQTIDGVALNTIGQRVLLTAQTTATQNGLWVVASGAWTRPTDFATGSGAAQSYVLVTGGTANAGSAYYDTNASGSDIVDTSNLTWTLFTQSASVTAGAGLTKTGNTIDVVAADGTITVAADSIAVGIIGNANLADNTIALSRLANAGGQFHFLMRNSSGGGPWEDGTLAQAQSALGIFTSVGPKAVRAATTANITLSGTQTVDGVALVAGDRCLVKNQTTGSQNGIYVVASGAWTRATDAATTGQIFAGQVVSIGPEGTTNGKRVAMVTTADPITIGTTSITYSMDRIVPVTSTGPLDITSSAGSVGTSIEAARQDHAHSLPFAVLAAVLALASTAIGVNGQKISNVGAPTVSTDAARLADVMAATTGWSAPANPADNLKIAYANAGGIAWRAGVTTPNPNQLAFAAETTNSNLQFEHNTIIAKAKDSTGAAYNALLRWGINADEFKIGGGGTTDMAVMRCTGRSSVQYLWEATTGIGIQSLTSQGLAVTPVATTGTVNAALRVTDAAHTAQTASAERSSVLFDFNQTRQWATGALTNQRAFRILAPTISFVGASTVTTAATVAISGAPAAGTNATITRSYALLVEAGSVGFGATPSTLGLVNASYSGSGATLFATKDSGGNDRPVLTYTSTDHAQLGSGNISADIVAQGNTWAFGSTASFPGVGHGLAAGGYFAFTGSSAGSTAPGGLGLVRTSGSPGTIIGARNYDNTADNNVIGLSGNGTTFSDLFVGNSGTKGNNSLYLEAVTQAVIQIASTNTYVFGGSTANFTTAQLLFGSAPSSNGTINFSNTATVLIGAKNLSSVDRALLTWGSTDALTLGNSALTTVVSAAGGSWIFGNTASFPGVEHNIASSGFLSFGTSAHAGQGMIRGQQIFTIYGRNNAGTGDIDILRLGALADIVIVGGGTSTQAGLQLETTTGTVSLRVATVSKFEVSSTVVDCKTNNVKIDNTAGAPSAPASGGYLYAEGGALKWISSAGNINVIAPV